MSVALLSVAQKMQHCGQVKQKMQHCGQVKQKSGTGRKPTVVSSKLIRVIRSLINRNPICFMRSMERTLRCQNRQSIILSRKSWGPGLWPKPTSSFSPIVLRPLDWNAAKSYSEFWRKIQPPSYLLTKNISLLTRSPRAGMTST